MMDLHNSLPCSRASKTLYLLGCRGASGMTFYEGSDSHHFMYRVGMPVLFFFLRFFFLKENYFFLHITLSQFSKSK
ncbi:hypothetical protein BDV36DRAFT_262377 [Aspergillus pseudocaelatus]|uniref:Uncharacterized protein n=1 Tax=Aspergillus pseudocaelatus TaxID=1825620 RepID=A0ABQ6WHS8_9EURO|nr:hypothetical protein BDV36DRAFT_262377 [Aspergillus pseudocaelatus]